MIKNKLYTLFVCLVTALVTSCAQLALSQISQNRSSYNNALNDSDNQQMLLNIVRIHYGLSPYFIGVDTITTQSTLTIGTGDNSQVNSSPLNIGPTFWTLNPEVSFSQTPTITYTPLQGEKFVSSLLTTIPITKISFLLDSGWRIDKVLQLTLSKIGDLENNDMLGSTDFNKFIELLHDFDQRNLIDTQVTSSYGQNNALLVTINDKAAAKQIAKLLKLSKPHDFIILTRHYAKLESTPEFVIPLKSRSLYGVMAYLSRGVIDYNESMAYQQGLSVLHHDGADESKSLLKVMSTKQEPSNNVLVKVPYEGQWFYITNDNMVSKNTLSLLRLIFSMQMGDVGRNNLPVVTIPIR